MKKLIISLVIMALVVPQAFAATIISDYSSSVDQNYIEVISPVTITAESDGEITAEHGINILIDEYRYILWHSATLSASGSAVDNGRLPASVTPVYLNDYKILHIDVLSNWEAGETVRLNGLKLRGYDREVGKRFLELDINGDEMADAIDINTYKVNNVLHSDNVPPYAVTDVEYTVNEDKTEVSFTWQNPPDYDFNVNRIERTLLRNGYNTTTDVLSAILTTEFTDYDVLPTDHVTYRIHARDRRNDSAPFEITFDMPNYVHPVAEPQEESQESLEEESPESQETEEPTEEESELASLTSLFNYYKIRQAIKCRTSSGSDCLMAKVNLVYAQEKLDRSDVNISLSERDLELMRLRIKWPEMRYQTKCIEASVPDKTCSALGKALKRAHYFID